MGRFTRQPLRRFQAQQFCGSQGFCMSGVAPTALSRHTLDVSEKLADGVLAQHLLKRVPPVAYIDFKTIP
jgi:hypothetical protein